MVSENELKKMIEQVLCEVVSADKKDTDKLDISNSSVQNDISGGILPDITEKNLRDLFYVPNPENREAYMKAKQMTSARLGMWRTGTRYNTESLLRFRADHAAAMDAVFTSVPEEFIKKMNLFSIKTKCKDKDEYLTRPDLGRQFEKEELDKVREKCIMKPQVQIYVSDGLSSTSIESNVSDVLPAMIQGLEGYGIKVGTPFFVKYGRVPAMDVISETLDAEVTCVLIGERPGLVTAESMSAYMAYRATVNMPEARRTVVSNIHRGGTPPVEAGAHIADIIKTILEEKKSGVDLKL
ncbi:ethanolamine ammonia-lyase light chain [Clostridium ragsdalei P11]|uniref:Ethanolamine ammonia-lyase small subunit n=1 Tax=Clostridium ragsdalei P11 TaxID=1353534 RepID=A0A1A6B3B7_9CLOT|nr:ethanolamine ammonia-lyase subunit EutC [Clostridium ragsdalei]OBR96787.1 ethanolamine ammonia-lyase light chain [Clostridium ragsdalei P11]